MRDHITLMGAEEVSRAVSNFGGHVDTLRGILSFHDEALQRHNSAMQDHAIALAQFAIKMENIVSRFEAIAARFTPVVIPDEKWRG